MDDRFYILFLRLVHILAGIFWVGAAFIVAGFLVPTVRATGREGARFMQHVMQQRRLPVYIGIAMLLTLLSGFMLYGRIMAASGGAWAGSASGIGYGVGGLAAVLGALVGILVSGAAGRRMAAIGGQAAQSGGLSAEQQKEMERLQARMTVGSRAAAALVAIAAAAMATSRYL
jgi:uncharacterized membrane protein